VAIQLVEKLGEHLKGKITESDIKQGITRGFVELNEQVRGAVASSLVGRGSWCVCPTPRLLVCLVLGSSTPTPQSTTR
jgi:hypothetical protein